MEGYHCSQAYKVANRYRSAFWQRFNLLEPFTTDNGANGISVSDQAYAELARLTCDIHRHYGLKWPNPIIANKMCGYENPAASYVETPASIVPAASTITGKHDILHELEKLYNTTLLPSALEWCVRMYEARLVGDQAVVQRVSTDAMRYIASTTDLLIQEKVAARSAGQILALKPTLENWTSFLEAAKLPGTPKDIKPLINMHERKIKNAPAGDQQQLALNAAFAQLRPFYK